MHSKYIIVYVFQKWSQDVESYDTLIQADNAYRTLIRNGGMESRLFIHLRRINEYGELIYTETLEKVGEYPNISWKGAGIS